MVGIYKITNKQNGMCYIGQTDDLERRISEHKQKRIVTIDDYINVLGVENFDFEILEECSSDELDEKEKFYIKKFNQKIKVIIFKKVVLITLKERGMDEQY